ncbi:glycosyltransferase family 2 protein [Rickettsiales bacterium]|nr:glycosyltransferase family 2 protein [Rickettsiales bacterium]
MQSKSKLPISVFIIAKNEEDRIIHTINSVKDWAQEVIVIDSGSDDKTVKISDELGAKVVFHEWKGYGPQKIYGETLCSEDWLLNLDADESVSEKLRDELFELFEEPELIKYHAYRLRIKIQGRFADKPGRFAPDNEPIRLYNKNHAGFKDSTVHDSVTLNDPKAKAGILKNIVAHRCFRSFSHAVNKINFYTTMQAEDLVKRKKIPSSLRIIVEPFFTFFKAYFLRRYFLLGIDGFIESIIYVFARTLRLAKARELYKAKLASDGKNN